MPQFAFTTRAQLIVRKPFEITVTSAHIHYFRDSGSFITLQAVNRRSSQECYDLWKKIPEDAIIITGSDEFVPQTLYRPLTKADKERYLELVHLSPPVIFLTKEPLEWGIPLEDVRNGRMQHLADKDDPVLQNCGPSVSIRINVSEALKNYQRITTLQNCSPVAWIFLVQTPYPFAKLAQDEGSDHKRKASAQPDQNCWPIHRGMICVDTEIGFDGFHRKCRTCH